MSQPLALSLSDAMLGAASSPRARLLRRALLIVGGSLLIAGAAQVQIPLPFSPVPITGQTFAVLLIAAALGPLDGMLAVLLYLGQGSAGAPFFAGGLSGWGTLTGATGGYLFGFIPATVLTGTLARRGWDRSFSSAVAAMLSGTVVIYVCGVLWLAWFMGASPLSQELLLWGLYPFIIGDLLKVYGAAALLPGGWKLARRSGPDA